MLPVMDKDKSAILSQLHDSHVIARSDAFHELQVSSEGTGRLLAPSSTCNVLYTRNR